MWLGLACARKVQMSAALREATQRRRRASQPVFNRLEGREIDLKVPILSDYLAEANLPATFQDLVGDDGDLGIVAADGNGLGAWFDDLGREAYRELSQRIDRKMRESLDAAAKAAFFGGGCSVHWRFTVSPAARCRAWNVSKRRSNGMTALPGVGPTAPPVPMPSVWRRVERSTVSSPSSVVWNGSRPANAGGCARSSRRGTMVPTPRSMTNGGCRRGWSPRTWLSRQQDPPFQLTDGGLPPPGLVRDDTKRVGKAHLKFRRLILADALMLAGRCED